MKCPNCLNGQLSSYREYLTEDESFVIVYLQCHSCNGTFQQPYKKYGELRSEMLKGKY